MENIIEILNKNNIIIKNKPSINAINSLSLTKFKEINEEIDNLIKKNHKPVKNPSFSYAASEGLSGGSFECDYIECRIERINRLARFSLMYSDEVYINSFFKGYEKIENKNELEFVKNQFYEDLLVVKDIIPLIRNGNIKIYSPEIDVCFSCQAREFIGNNAGNNFDKEYKRLKLNYLNNMSVNCRKEYGEYGFDCCGSAPYFDHTHVITLKQLPEFISKKPRIFSKIEKGIEANISKDLIRKLGFHIDYAHIVASNAIHGVATSSCLNTRFITENEMHIKFLNRLNDNYEIRERNRLAEKYLTTMVPYIEDVSLSDILKIRNREKESFIVFRQSLNNAIDSIRSIRGKFTKAEAQDVYSDIIAPSISKLDKKVAKAKRDLVTKSFRTITGVTGAITFGLLTGLASVNIANVAKVIGLVKFADLLTDTMGLGDKESKIEEDKFYFLWKVKKKQKKQKT